MRKINLKYFILLLVPIAVMSCRDESKVIYDTSKLPTGAYARMLALPPATASVVQATFATTDFPFQAEVDGVGANASAVTSLDVKVQLLDPNGVVLKPYVPLGSITTWAVVPSTTELPRGTADFKGSDIITALGLVAGDFAVGNIIECATTLKLKDGRVFTSDNFDPNMSNTFYLAAYDYATTLQ